MNQINQSILADMTSELHPLSKQYIFDVCDTEDVLTSEQLEFLDYLTDCFALYDNYVIVTGNTEKQPYNLSILDIVEFFEINLELLISVANTDIFSQLNT